MLNTTTRYPRICLFKAFLHRGATVACFSLPPPLPVSYPSVFLLAPCSFLHLLACFVCSWAFSHSWLSWFIRFCLACSFSFFRVLLVACNMERERKKSRGKKSSECKSQTVVLQYFSDMWCVCICLCRRRTQHKKRREQKRQGSGFKI